MKPISITVLLLLICVCVYGQPADKILRPRASPFVASSPNNLVGVDTNNNFTIWAFDKDSLKIMPWNLRWLNDSIIAVGDRRFALTSASYNNPSWIAQLSASKVFGLSPVALTGDYNDLSNKPNMALYYLASNPAGYISNVTSGMISAALGYQPLASETDPTVPSNVKAITGTNISNWNTSYGWGNHATEGYLKGVDTGSLSNRINARLSFSDTGSLSNRINAKLTSTDTLSLSSRINTKQATLNGTGFIKASGTTISYDNSTYYLSSNPSGYISSVPAQSFASLTGKPTTLSGYGITDGYSTSNPSSYINQAGARSAISLTTTGTGVATYNNSTGVLNVPTPVNSKRIDTYSGTTIADGSYTITFSSAFPVAPSIQASITNQASTNQFIRVTSVSTTGCVINVFQRSAVTLLGIEVLLAATTNVSGATIDVLAISK